MKEIIVSTPGRICLFGEDVDYMGLEVITIAIDRRIEVKGNITNTGEIRVNLNDFDQVVKFKNERQKIISKRDYIKSAFNLYCEYLPSNFGANITVNSNLLIGKGLSSSSAFASAFVAFFDRAAEIHSKEEEIAWKAYLAEVVNLGEPGGMMDHYASVLGNVIYLECREPYLYEKLDMKLGNLVIGDTLKRKETIELLTRRKREIKKGIEILDDSTGNFNLLEFPLEKALSIYEKQKKPELKRILGVLGIRDTVREGYKLVKSNRDIEDEIISLINTHHDFQKIYFENVTEKMQFLIDKAKQAGAKACKLLGTGNGGSFLAYAPGKEKEVLKSILDSGGEAYLVKQDNGLKISERS
jgi:galactokinase